MVIRDTLPVGVPVPLLAVTAISTLTACPWVIVVGLRLVIVVVVGRKVIEFQWLTRLATLTEPRPVARS